MNREKKGIGIIHPRHQKSKSFKVRPEKKEVSKYGKLPNDETLVKLSDRPAPPSPKQPIRDQMSKDLSINYNVLCNSCKIKDVCKYQDDYLKQMIRIIDAYGEIFNLNCNYYEHPEVAYMKKLEETYGNDLSLLKTVMDSQFNVVNKK